MDSTGEERVMDVDAHCLRFDYGHPVDLSHPGPGVCELVAVFHFSQKSLVCFCEVLGDDDPVVFEDFAGLEDCVPLIPAEEADDHRLRWCGMRWSVLLGSRGSGGLRRRGKGWASSRSHSLTATRRWVEQKLATAVLYVSAVCSCRPQIQR